MPTVYVPQQPRAYDKTVGRMVNKFNTTEKLERFGDVVVMMDRNDDVWNPHECVAKMKRIMRGFSDEDYLVPMGSHTFMMWASIIAASRCRNELQTLQWNARNEDYVVIRTKVTQLRLESSSEEQQEESRQEAQVRGLSAVYGGVEVTQRRRDRRG